jgi:plastocyanin
MKRVLISLLALTVIIAMLTGCTNNPSSPNPTAPETHDISMTNSMFSPATITINEGDTIRWTNNDIRAHTSTSGTNGVPDGIWNSNDVAPGNTYERVFNAAGTFPFYCMHHWQTGMTGTITVVTP